MKMRSALSIGILAVVALGCNRGPKDASQVLVNASGDKITKAQFEEVVKNLVGDPKQAEAILTVDAMREQRNQILDSMALQKAIIQDAKAQGLDKDAKTRFMVEQSTAQIYLRSLMDRRLAKLPQPAPPTDAELQQIYDQGVAQRKAAGQTKDLPTFEQVKPQLLEGAAQRKRQEQSDAEFKALLAELRQKHPMTFADGYKPAPQP